ncbi:hypothetical protein [Salinibacter ruber]|jgi:hypothetical protein|uniref:Uncharacterized protein n=1 Tax=Salinibacter ruber TaxID=146919 RepID=A0AAW5P841_9BACT|nr:hypothetical protein [Salinibacter ruber]MCS4157639.1 hypothetical protein [Salinibacter ruber]
MVNHTRGIEGSLTEDEADDFYPSKLFSMADYHMPDNIKEIFRFCRYLVMSDPIVSGAVHKMAEAPVTQVVYEHESEPVKNKYQELFEQQLNVREKFLEAGIDLAVYSNAFLSLRVPVQRYLISPNANGTSEIAKNELKKQAEQVRKGQRPEAELDQKVAENAEEPTNGHQLPDRYKAKNINWSMTGDGRFKGKCPKTGKEVIFERQDRYYPSAQNLSIKKWDPNQIEIHHNEVTGENRYYYQLQHDTKELIKDNNRWHLNNDPWEYIKAAREDRNVRIKEERLHHLSNVKVSGAFNGWGIPRLYSAFKLIFYYMTLLRSNEQVARGKIQDLDILFPQSQSGMLDPVAAMPGSSFKKNVKSILKNWRDDPNFVGVSPIPVGNVKAFGKGRMQLITEELQPIFRMITTAMGIPYELLFGGGKYSGMAVQQRLFSAQTGLHAERFNEALDFFQDQVVANLGEEQFPSSMNMHLKDYEGPDDQKRKKTRAQAAMNNMLSLSTFFEDQGLDPESEWQKMEEDAKRMGKIKEIRGEAQARAKAEGQEIVQRKKMELQDDMEEAQKEEGGPDPRRVAKKLMQKIKQSPKKGKQLLRRAKKKYPQAYKLVRQQMDRQQGEVPSMEAPTASPDPTEDNQGGSSPVSMGMPEDSTRQSSGQRAGKTIGGEESEATQQPPQNL